MNNLIADEIEKIIIPSSTIKSFLKKFNKKSDDLFVDIIQIDSTRFEIITGPASEIFQPINSKYPDFKNQIEEIENHSGPDIFNNYNWEYLSIAHKAMCEHTLFRQCIFKSTENLGYFWPDPELIYIIMPLKFK